MGTNKGLFDKTTFEGRKKFLQYFRVPNYSVR